MIITCNKCNARFNLEDTLIKSEGTKIRCANCREIFLVQSPSPLPAEPEHRMAGAPEDFNENFNSTDNLLGIDDMLDMDSISEEAPEKSEDFDLFSIEDLQEEANEEFGLDAGLDEFDPECELEDIGRGLQLEPDRGEKKGFEPKVEFDDTDEFAKYGTLEFNVSDMYKTLGIEVESKVETEQELTELNPDLNSEEDELDLSGIDEMLDIEEDQLGAQENEPPYAEPDDACMELDLSDLEDMLGENEAVDGNGPSELHPDLEDAIDEEDEINAQTEIFNIEDIEDLDMKTGKAKELKKGSSPDAAETDADDFEGLDIGSTEKRGAPFNDDLEFQLDLDPDANKGDEEEAPELLDLGSDSDDLGGILMNDADLGLEIEEEEDEVESLSLDLEQELEQNFSNSFSDFSQELNRDGRIPPDTDGEESDDLLSFDLEPEASDVDVDDPTEVMRLDEEAGSDLDLDEPAPRPREDGFEFSDMDLLASHENVPPEEKSEEGLDLDLGEESIDLDDVMKMDELEEREASEDLELGVDIEPASDELGLDLELEADELEPDEFLAETEPYISDGDDLDELEAVNTDTDPGEAAEALDIDLDLDLEEGETGSAADEAFEELDLDANLAEAEDHPEDSFEFDLDAEEMRGEPEGDEEAFDLGLDESETEEAVEVSLDPAFDITEKVLDSEDEEEESDLDLDLDHHMKKDQEEQMNMVGLDLEAPDEKEAEESFELDFDLEGTDMEESTGVKAGQPQTPEHEIELDFDFDMDEEDASTDRKEESLEFDLNLDLDGDEEEELESSKEMDSDDISFELDLTSKEYSQDFDIEAGQEKETESAPVEQKGSGEMEFDVNFETKSNFEEVASEGSDEFDLDFEEEEEIAVESELRKQETEKKEDEFSDAFDMGIPADELDDLGYEESDLNKPEKKKVIRKQRKRSPAVLLLSILLFGGAGYGAYTMGFHERLTDMGFSLSKVSGIGGIFRSQPQHLGEIVPLGNTVESKFIKNEEAGYLFVVRGDVKNEYSENRSFIKIRGKLYKNDNQLAVEEAVFAGNSLTDEELASMPLADIEARLANPSGAQNSNVRIHPGKVLPYTLVFSEVSPDFEEYRVEVAGSRPAE